MSQKVRGFRHWCRETKGVAMVEFAIVVTVLCLIIAGIMDLGHAFYLQQVVTNASREGARFGVAYRADADHKQIAPPNQEAIKTYLDSKFELSTLLPKASVEVSLGTFPDGTVPNATTGYCGVPLTVTVKAIKTWFILDNFIPTFGDSKELSHSTVMRCE